jgi:probable phosphoglycerate mutase
MTVLIIARHGNTFEDDELPRRVGARTDIPLTEKGREQARMIGKWLKESENIPDVVFYSYLRRTRETAALALEECGKTVPMRMDVIFNEIDYGPDENKTEAETIARIGASAIKDWDGKAIVPSGWIADPAAIAANWISFGVGIKTEFPTGKILVVTSNGIARFAPHMTGDFENFRARNNIKLATGALCVLRHDGMKWDIEAWNIRPS